MMIDMVCDTANEMFGKWAGIALFTPDDQKDAAWTEFKDGGLRNFMNMVEAQLAKNSTNKFLVGETMTIADFSMISFIFNCLNNENGPFHSVFSDFLLEFPMVGAYSKRLYNEQKKHLDSRPKCAF